MQFLFELRCPRTCSHCLARMSVVFVSETTLYLLPFKGVVPSQSILGVEPYCGLTVHEAEVLVPEPPPLADPVDRHP